MVHITTPLHAPAEVRDVYIAEGNRFAIVATASGAEVINLLTGTAVSFGTIPGSYEPLCVAADWTTATGLLYVGTSGGGIFSTRYHATRKPGSDFSGSLVQHYSTTTDPPISDNVVRDLAVRPARLFVGTALGVDFVAGSQSSTRAVPAGTSAVHLTDSGGGYWTTTSSVEVNYDLISTTGTGIIGIDFAYTLTSTPDLPGVPPVDIAISESTNPTVLAFASSAGVTVIEEQPGSEATANQKDPSSEDIVSVDFSNEASFSDGFFYYATSSTLRILDLSNDTVSGTHTVEAGARDQTLVTGTVTVVRTTDVA